MDRDDDTASTASPASYEAHVKADRMTAADPPAEGGCVDPNVSKGS